jgi:2-phospho-L-lactate transferase/gluconeogenesis factor (CofD/UPF0052 family)
VGQDSGMTETVHVEAARNPDRDRLLEELRASGLDARPVDEIGIEVPIESEAEEAADEVLAHAESVIMSIGAPFVPIKHEGTIYIRPPLS